MSERRPSFGKRLTGLAIAAAMLAAPPTALATTEPHGRAYASMLARTDWLKRHRPRSAYREGDRPCGERPGPARRQHRRQVARVFEALMQRPLSGRQWVRVRRALKRNAVRGTTSPCARFFGKIHELNLSLTAGAAAHA